MRAQGGIKSNRIGSSQLELTGTFPDPGTLPAGAISWRIRLVTEFDDSSHDQTDPSGLGNISSFRENRIHLIHMLNPGNQRTLGHKLPDIIIRRIAIPHQFIPLTVQRHHPNVSRTWSIDIQAGISGMPLGTIRRHHPRRTPESRSPRSRIMQNDRTWCRGRNQTCLRRVTTAGWHPISTSNSTSRLARLATAARNVSHTINGSLIILIYKINSTTAGTSPAFMLVTAFMFMPQTPRTAARSFMEHRQTAHLAVTTFMTRFESVRDHQAGNSQHKQSGQTCPGSVSVYHLNL